MVAGWPSELTVHKKTTIAECDPFRLQVGEEALGNRIAVTIPTTPHAGFKDVITQEFAPVAAGVLNALIGVMLQ